MGAGDVRLNYPGLLREKHGNGTRWRVRVKGDTSRRITLPCGPDDPDFHDIYTRARRGERIARTKAATVTPGTMGWILQTYLDHLSRMVKAGQASPLTLKQRKGQIAFILDQTSEQPRTKGLCYEGLPMTIPPAELLAFRDRMAETPGKARNVWKTLIAAYDHAVERGYIGQNPARAVKRPAYKSQGGATPWTLDDLNQYRKAHPPGTMAHLALTLFMFTACRIGDAVTLGRAQEEHHGGELWLAWQPAKKGSKFVRIPVLPPLVRAIKSQTVIGPTYLLTAHGKPFTSPEALRNRFKKWCVQAGLPDRSSHGIRKAAGHLLALHGATQYEIMSVHGHANAATSQVYTESVERMKLGSMAVTKLAGMEW
jgi:integrase